jgi:hypothetical protein
LESFSFTEQFKFRTCTPFLANVHFWRLLIATINSIDLQLEFFILLCGQPAAA